MRFSTTISVFLVAGVARAQFGGFPGQGSQFGGGGAGQFGQTGKQEDSDDSTANQKGKGLALDPKNVQTGSQSSGLDDGAEAGQAASDTDNANFINFCTGKTITNGLQVRQGSCNGIPMGDIPSASQMVSAVFTSPQNNQVIAPNTAIKFSVQIANLQAGTFTNPDNTYYSAPQALSGGNIVGHTHITVQDLGGSANPTKPLDAQTFAFFKGINDDGNGNGLLSADLADGLPEGFYRVCSLTSSSNHQPVLMPVAQRGAQDDCVRFQVSAGGGNNNNNKGNKGNQVDVNNQNQQVGQGQVNQDSTGQQQAQQTQTQQGQGQGQGQQDQAQPTRTQQPGGGRGGGGGRRGGRGRSPFQKRRSFTGRTFDS